MKGRYRKKSFAELLAVRMIIPFIIAFAAHCVIYFGTVKLKLQYVPSANNAAVSILTDEIMNSEKKDTESIIKCFEEYYPNHWDYGHSGLEETALVFDANTLELIASNDFTLPENNFLAELKNDSEKYLSLIEPYKYTFFVADKNETLFGCTIDSMSEYKQYGDRKIRIFTRFHMNYYMYFLKYFLPMDIILFVCALAAAFVLAFQKKTKIMQDDYRRNIINSLSHDLKTPLTIISGCAENLRENVNPEKREFYENSIIENVKYTESIISSALELTGSEKGIIKPVYSKFSAAELICELWKKYEFTASEKGITLNINGDTSLKADRKMISQLFENLISNTVKYTDENGKADIEINRKTIIFSNDFSGEIDTDAEKLTEPFVRGKKERTGRTGSGIGLAIVKNIADSHKYKLHTELKNKRFTVIIKL